MENKKQSNVIVRYNNLQNTLLDDNSSNVKERNQLICSKKNNCKKKVSEVEFKILKYDEYHELNKRKYQVSQLKKICQYYKQKVSGNKDELQKRVYTFLKDSYYIHKIQSRWRKKLIRRLIISRGPGYKQREKCINETDFYTMEDIVDIPAKQFISFQDNEGGIYGFNIVSIYNMVLRTKMPLINPYNRGEINKKIIDHLHYIIRVSKILGVEIELQIEEPEELSREKKAEMRALDLFQSINDLGNYSDHKWFTVLNKIQLIRFIREMMDIWNYRAQLIDAVKREICPPYGDPYRDINLYILPRLDSIELQERSLNLIDKLINSGINQSSKALGANFVLCALTLVNQDAANALPWLYESVAPIILD